MLFKSGIDRRRDRLAVKLFPRHRLLQPPPALGLLPELCGRRIAGIPLVVDVFVFGELRDDRIDDLLVRPYLLEQPPAKFLDRTRLGGKQPDRAVHRPLPRTRRIANNTVLVLYLGSPSSHRLGFYTPLGKKLSREAYYLLRPPSRFSVRMMEMDGILVIDKPAGMTSHDVVARLRRILKTRKIGHTGTLDPFATGVLVMLVGRATRLAQFLDKDEKEYDALVTFGYETETGDRTGERRATEPRADLAVTPDALIETIGKFMGEIKQVPPMYSAKKIAGRKLYELAREGKEVEREPADVTIYKLDLSQDRVPAEPEEGTFHLRFQVRCSAGTYIRTLAEDIGRELGTGAHLEELRRTAAGKFRIETAVTLDDLVRADDPSRFLLPLTEALGSMPEFTVREGRVAQTLNGLATRVSSESFTEGQRVKMLSESGELLAIGTFNPAENTIQPTLVLAGN